MKTHFLILLTVFITCFFILAHGQTSQLHKILDVTLGSTIQLESDYSSVYNGYLATGKFTSLPIINSPTGQTRPFGNIAVWNGDTVLLDLDGGLSEETTCGTFVGDTIYAGTQTGKLYRYEPVAGWEQLPFNADAPIYNIGNANGSLLIIGKFSTVNGLPRQHIVRYRLDSGATDSVGQLPSLSVPIELSMDDMAMVSDGEKIYFSWFNSSGVDNAWFIYDVIAQKLINPAYLFLFQGAAITINGSDVYVSGTDATVNDRIWKVSDTTVTLICTGGLASAMTVRNDILYFTGYFWNVTLAGGSPQTLGNDIMYDGVSLSAWSKAPEVVSFNDLTTTPSGEMIASINYALYSTASIATGIENLTHASFSIFPNPASGKMQLNFPDSEPGEIAISDIRGRLLLNVPHVQESTHDVDLSNLGEGLYVLTFKSKTKVVSQRFVKQ